MSSLMESIFGSNAVNLASEICPTCKMQFAMSAVVQADLRKTGETFYCPIGHRQHYSPNENEELKKQIFKLERDKAEILAERKSWGDRRLNEIENLTTETIVFRRNATRALHRTEKGRCPHCKFVSAEMANHVAENHQD